MAVKVNPWDVGVKPRIVQRHASGFCRCSGADIIVYGPTPEIAYRKWQQIRAYFHKFAQGGFYDKPLALPFIGEKL